MILVDSAVGSWELQSLIVKQGIACDKTQLTYADACFEGFGPDGLVAIGVERKRIGDILQCIDDGRFTGHQRIGMAKMYRFSFLIIEGYWKPDTGSGVLLEGHPKRDGSLVWSPYRPGGRVVMYHKLRRYLFSLSLGGVVVLYSRDLAQTAYDICELYHWFQKQWRDHKSLLAMHRGYFWQQDGRTDQLMALPAMMQKPSLVRRWAAELSGVGVRKSEEAARVFKTPRAMVEADADDWQQIDGIGPVIANRIVKEIGG